MVAQVARRSIGPDGDKSSVIHMVVCWRFWSWKVFSPRLPLPGRIFHFEVLLWPQRLVAMSGILFQTDEGLGFPKIGAVLVGHEPTVD